MHLIWKYIAEDLQKVVETVMKLILSLEYFWLICQTIIYKQELHIQQDINA